MMTGQSEAEGERLFEITYVADASFQRHVMLDWLWHDSVAFFAYTVLGVASVLVMVFSANLRLAAAVLFGVALAYFISLAQRVPRGAQEVRREVAIRLSDTALVYRYRDEESTFRWPATHSLSLTRRFVFMAIGSRSLAVPRSALPDEALAFLLTAAREAGARVRGK